MIEKNKIQRLTPEDKLFMIYNTNCFSLPTSSTIQFYEEAWKNDIDTFISPDKIINHINKRDNTIGYNKLVSVSLYKLNKEVSNDILNKLKKIVNLPCETKENIQDIIYMIGIIEKIIDNNHIFHEDTYKQSLIKYIFTELLPWKLQAHEIILKLNTDIIPKDETLKEFYYKNLRFIINEIMEEHPSYNKMSILLYQLLSYLNINDKSNSLFGILINIIKVLFNYNPKILSDSVVSLLDGNMDILSAIDNISDNNSDIFKNIISNTKRQLEENYEKNKISTSFNDKVLCIGDQVFDNGEISLSRLMVELDMLSEESLKDYIGEIKSTTFNIPENDIGYLKLKENIPVCKVMTPKSFYTIIRYDNKSYLLFKILGDNKCYGISFPSVFGGERKVVVFEIPKEYEYQMVTK